MNRTLVLLLLLSAPAMAQRNEIWSNAGLTARGVQAGEQRAMLRQHMSQCHGAAFEGTRGVQEEEKRKQLGVALFKRCSSSCTRGVQEEEKRKQLGVALFKRCMAERGWTSRDASAPKPAPKAPKPTTT